MNILISAFACLPNMGSEPGVGWNWVKQLSKHKNLIVVTREYDEFGNNCKKMILEELKKNNINNVEFIFYNLPRFLDFLLYGQKIHLYYYLWQKIIFVKLRQMKIEEKINLVHHITYNEFRTPGSLWKLKKPFIFGPVGGGHNYPRFFNETFGKSIFFEVVRMILNYISLYSITLRKALKKSEIIFIADDSTYNFLPRKYKYKFEKMLEAGIDFSSITEKIKYNKLDNIRLLWVGNIIPRKGLPLLIKAMKSIDKSVKLTIVGDGTDRKRNEDMVNRLKLNDRIEFIGAQKYNEIKDHYLSSDIFIFTSLRDTSGNVVLEAMAFGLPIICLNHHGVKDIVSDNGIKINPLNENYVIEELAINVNKLAKDEELRKTMGEKSIERIKNNYDWLEKGKAMNEYYNKIILDQAFKDERKIIVNQDV